MTKITAMTKALLTLSAFFVCATLGAGLALFTGCSTSANRTAGTVNVISISLTDRTGSMFTW